MTGTINQLVDIDNLPDGTTVTLIIERKGATTTPSESHPPTPPEQKLLTDSPEPSKVVKQTEKSAKLKLPQFSLPKVCIPKSFEFELDKTSLAILSGIVVSAAGGWLYFQINPLVPANPEKPAKASPMKSAASKPSASDGSVDANSLYAKPLTMEMILEGKTIEGMEVIGPFPVGPGFNAPRPGGREHAAIDISTPKGTMLRVPGDGIVDPVNDSVCGYGIVFYPDVKPSKKAESAYMVFCHLSKLALKDGFKKGQAVKAGDVVGLSGGVPGDPGAGSTTGAHLHLAVAFVPPAIPEQKRKGQKPKSVKIRPTKTVGLRILGLPEEKEDTK